MDQMYIGKFKDFVEKDKDSKVIMARGDCKQLKSAQPITNTEDYEPYVDSTTDNIFEHHILLKVCKRLRTDADREKLHNIKQNIFLNKISVDGLVKKYGFRLDIMMISHQALPISISKQYL